jgi:transcriptional regulator with XRE-family HTH domain
VSSKAKQPVFRSGDYRVAVNRFTNNSSRSSLRKRLLYRESCHSFLPVYRKMLPLRRSAAGWVGYIIRMERQRQSLTQTHIASQLGFGMSYVSTIESGNAFTNFDRTMMLIEYFGINSCTCIGAIEAQIMIQELLLQKSQSRKKRRANQRPQWSQASLSYHQVVADRSIDTPGQSRASSSGVRQNRSR